MPKQQYQRPVRVAFTRNLKSKSGAPGQADFGRKTGRPMRTIKTGKTSKK